MVVILSYMYHTLGHADVLLIFLSNWTKNFFKKISIIEKLFQHMGLLLTFTRPGNGYRCEGPSLQPASVFFPLQAPSHTIRGLVYVCVHTTTAHLSSVCLPLPSQSLAPLGTKHALPLGGWLQVQADPGLNSYIWDHLGMDLKCSI